MKKQILFFLSLLFVYTIFAENKESKIVCYENSKEGIYIRKSQDVNPYDDETGNKLYFTDDGKLVIYQIDSQIVFSFENANYQVINEKKDYKLPFLSCLRVLGKEVYIFQNQYNNCFAISEKTGEKKFYIEEYDISINGIYYNEEQNILFFTDKNSNIHSIINPGMDDEQNKKNYRNPEQTRELFSKDSEYGKKGLVIDGKKLIISGSGFFWRNPNINGKQYACYDDSFSIWEGRSKIYGEDYSKKTDEEFESAAVHPSGDIYVLRMNWSTNTHNLYRIENTWDPEWREQWYKEHPEAN